MAVLAWLLSEAAERAAAHRRLARVHVAAELWIQIRCYPWMNPGTGSIPATILFTTVRVTSSSDPSRQRHHNELVDMPEPDVGDESVMDLLMYAQPNDRELLIDLALLADQVATSTDRRAGRSRGAGGLLGPACRHIAAKRGVSDSTIKRQVWRALTAIREGIAATP